jgi:uncharacterized protein (UPF0261 family)
LKNISTLDVDLVIGWTNELLQYSNNFQLLENKFVLAPGACDTVKICASPAIPGRHQEELIFVINDNPEIFSIKVRETMKGTVE